MEKYKIDFIEFMIDCGVLKFGDFVTKSNRKTPFFINTGCYCSGSQLSGLGTYYAKAIEANFSSDFDVLFGPAYKGIPLSVATSMKLNDLSGQEVRYCSNRKEVKDHGDTGILLGSGIKEGDRVLIIEDVTTAGTSIEETMPILNNLGAKVQGLIVSVDRCERGKGEQSALKEISDKYKIKTAAIVTMKEVIEHLHNKEYKGKIIINDEIKNRIDEYYDIYGIK